jgi:hypothetical protein
MGVLALTVFVALVKLGPPRSPAFWARALAGAYLAGVLVAFGYHEMVDPIGTPEADPRIHLGIALVWPMGLILDLVRALV